MFLNMLKFEYHYFLRQPSFIVVSLVMFLLPFLSVAIEQVQIGANSSNILLNGPFPIALTILIMSFFGMFLVVNFVANTALRNHSTRMSELLYTNPIDPMPYQLGRLAGAFLIVLTASSMVPLGMLLGSVMPWLDPMRLAQFDPYSYIAPFIIFTVPTCFILTCFFYTAAIRFKSMMSVYLFALALFAMYAISSGAFAQSQHREILALFDPFGLRSFFETTRYWTANQKNNDIISLSDVVLYNRLFWVMVSGITILVFGKIFGQLAIEQSTDKSHPIDNNHRITKQHIDSIDWDINEFTAGYDVHSKWFQFVHLLAFEVRQILFSPAFIVLLIFAIVLVVAKLLAPSAIYGTNVYPLTMFMVELINNAFSLSLLIIITFYSAELVFKERTTRMGDIIDSTPVTNLAFYCAKFISLCTVILSMLFVASLTTIIFQLVSDVHAIDISQYFKSLTYFVALPFMLLAVVAFLIQTLSPNKYIGMLFFVGFLFIPVAFANLGINHNMVSYASSPQLIYSDINEYGWFLTTQYNYMSYWVSLAIGLSAVSFAMWQRGPDSNVLKRLQQLPYQLGKTGQVLIMLSLICFVSFGTVIYYNTTQINDFYTESELNEIAIKYEKQFAQFERMPIVSATDVDLNVAIFPSIRKMEVIAKINYVNNSESAIERVLVNFPLYSSVRFVGARVEGYNPELRTAWLTFDKPLQPSKTIELIQYITRQHLGFKDRNEDTSLIQNGTFINNYELLAYIGVKRTNYISDIHLRRRNGLGKLHRANSIDDESFYSQSFLGGNATKINFSATISTSDDQTAIAPGKLMRYWKESNRNYFLYQSQKPIVNFFNIMSADLKVKSRRHNGVDINIYYHKSHKYNIDNMMKASRHSLDYFQSLFTPYPFEQLNIIEFPGYRRFAQSFANTIPYSERLGFVTDQTDPTNIDTVYYITAHEVAHQWFGHQLDAANVEGSNVLIEGLSQYAALQLMQHTYGEKKIRRFLKYELDRYLTGRANEDLNESPLMFEEGQNYIYYHKSSIVFMAIAQRIGEERLNNAIRHLLRQFSSQSPRLATSKDLLTHIKQEASEADHSFIDKLFKQITLHNIQLNSVTVDSNLNELKIEVYVEELESDEVGNEIKQQFDDAIEIVLFKGNPDDFSVPLEIIHRASYPMKSGENIISIDYSNIAAGNLLDTEFDKNATDVYIGVDPFIRFIDIDSNDNVQRLK